MAKARLGTAAETPIWLEADVTSEWALKPMDIWHDRAAFHFLTTPADRLRYTHHLLQKPLQGSQVIAHVGFKMHGHLGHARRVSYCLVDALTAQVGSSM